MTVFLEAIAIAALAVGGVVLVLFFLGFGNDGAPDDVDDGNDAQRDPHPHRTGERAPR